MKSFKVRTLRILYVVCLGIIGNIKHKIFSFKIPSFFKHTNFYQFTLKIATNERKIKKKQEKACKITT